MSEEVTEERRHAVGEEENKRRGKRGGKRGWGGEAGLGIRSWFSERITLFLSKNERMSNSLIRSYLVSDLSDSLTIAHFL